MFDFWNQWNVALQPLHLELYFPPVRPFIVVGLVLLLLWQVVIDFLCSVTAVAAAAETTPIGLHLRTYTAWGLDRSLPAALRQWKRRRLMVWSFTVLGAVLNGLAVSSQPVLVLLAVMVAGMAWGAAIFDAFSLGRATAKFQRTLKQLQDDYFTTPESWTALDQQERLLRVATNIWIAENVTPYITNPKDIRTLQADLAAIRTRHFEDLPWDELPAFFVMAACQLHLRNATGHKNYRFDPNDPRIMIEMETDDDIEDGSDSSSRPVCTP